MLGPVPAGPEGEVTRAPPLWVSEPSLLFQQLQNSKLGKVLTENC